MSVPSMYENEVPKVQLPEMIPRKPLAPGPNSWTQQHSRNDSTPSVTEETRRTNRDRHENKHMPDAPVEEPHQNPNYQPRPYIQPAVPLVGPVPVSKHRAVTDPIVPKALFTGRKPSVNQLRKKFNHSRQGSEDDVQPSLTFQYPTGKAAEILGFTPALTGPMRSTAPSSGQTDSKDADDGHSSLNNPLGQTIIAARQVQTSPVPATHHSRSEVEIDTPIKPDTISDGNEYHRLEQVREEFATPTQPPHAQSHSHLAPPKIANYGRVGGVGVVQGNGMNRVESFQGIIENAVSPVRSKEQSATETDGTVKSASNDQIKINLLQPKSYSPETYSRIWEDDPAVVCLKIDARPQEMMTDLA